MTYFRPNQSDILIKQIDRGRSELLHLLDKPAVIVHDTTGGSKLLNILRRGHFKNGFSLHWIEEDGIFAHDMPEELDLRNCKTTLLDLRVKIILTYSFQNCLKRPVMLFPGLTSKEGVTLVRFDSGNTSNHALNYGLERSVCRPDSRWNTVVMEKSSTSVHRE